MLSPLQPRIIPFYGDELVAVRQDDGQIFVLFARLCDNLGLRRYSQARRVQNHAVLSEGFTTLTTETEGGPQAGQCLRLDLLPLWLSGVQAGKVKNDIKEKLIRYQREAASVLWQAFKPEIVVGEEQPLTTESSQAIAQLEQVIEQSRAMQRMAEEQITLIRRMDAAARIVKHLQTNVTDIQIRLGVLEERVHPGAYITEEQSATVLNAVQTIAMEMTQQDKNKNHFQSIHGELHRRFRVSSYKLIRQEQYSGVLRFLEDWYKAATDGSEKTGEQRKLSE